MSRAILLGATCGVLAAVAIITLGCDKAKGEKARPAAVCEDVMSELDRAVEEGLISERSANEILIRCYEIYAN